MIKKIKITFITLLAIIGLIGVYQVALPSSANALFENSKQSACEGTQLANGAANCKTDAASNLNRIISNGINIFSLIIGIAAVIMIIVNGLRFIISGGDAQKVASARNGIIYAVIGLVVAALAQFIVHFVLAESNKAVNPPTGGSILDNLVIFFAHML